MKTNSAPKDPAFPAMAWDILGNVLSRAHQPAATSEYLTDEIRELTGARCVLFIERQDGTTYRIMSVNPPHRRAWAESAEAHRLFEVVRRLPAAQVWRADEPAEAAGLLRREGFDLSLVVPLNVGAVPVGAMLVLGLPDDTHLNAELTLLDTLSTLVALVLRNASLYERQEQAIQEGIREIQATNAALRTREAEARQFLETAERSRRALLNTLEDQARVEAALRASEERFRRLTENAPDMIYRMALPEGRYEYVSPAATELFGYTPAEFYDSPLLIREAIHPDWRGYFEQEWGKLLAGEVSPTCEYQITHRSGAVRWLNQRNIVITGADGRPTAIEGIVTDITERKQAEERVRRLNAELEQRVLARTAQLAAKNDELKSFTYTVSHDLKAPLRGITGYAQELERRHKDGLAERAQFCVTQIITASRNLDALIEDLLIYSRLDAETPTPANLVLADLVQSILRDHSLTIAALGVEVSVDVPPLTLRVWKHGLEQVLGNLIDNAIKYSRQSKPPRLAIRADASAAAVRVTVADNGIGFNMKYHDRIFGLFNRLVRANEFEGTGVGLAIVKKLVEKLGGSVRAESAPGQGATFFVDLPVQPGKDSTP